MGAHYRNGKETKTAGAQRKKEREVEEIMAEREREREREGALKKDHVRPWRLL